MMDLNEAKLETLLDIINSSAREAIAEYKKTGYGVPSLDSTTFHPLDVATDTLSLKRALRLLEGAYYQLSAILSPPQYTVFSFVHNYNWACTDVAARAHIADVLDKHPEGLHVDELADAVNLDKDKTARILRTLSLMGCFKEVKRNVFANTRVSLVLKSDSNAGCHIVHLIQDVSKYAGVGYESLMDPEFGGSNEVDKAPRAFALKKDGTEDTYWEMVKDDDDRRNNFHRGIVGHGEILGSSAILHHYPWHDVSSVVDIGSSIGSFSIPLAKMFPHIDITNQDLPEVIEQAQTVWYENAPEALLDDRVDFVALDFFQGLPVVGKDVYYLRNIIHDWPDVEATKILQNVAKAMGRNSRLLIHECVLRSPGESGTGTDGLSVAPEPMLPNFGAGSSAAYHQDLVMWFVLNSKERTVNELRIIGAAAGLALTQVYDLVGTTAVEFMIAQN